MSSPILHPTTSEAETPAYDTGVPTKVQTRASARLRASAGAGPPSAGAPQTMARTARAGHMVAQGEDAGYKPDSLGAFADGACGGATRGPALPTPAQAPRHRTTAFMIL